MGRGPGPLSFLHGYGRIQRLTDSEGAERNTGDELEARGEKRRPVARGTVPRAIYERRTGPKGVARWGREATGKQSALWELTQQFFQEESAVDWGHWG